MRFLRFLSFAQGQYLGGSQKSHMAFWGEEKCTLEASNRRKKSFKRRLRTYRRAFRRRHHLAKYKIQLVFLAVSQRVGLYILLPLYLFRHADSPRFRGLFFCAKLRPRRRCVLQPARAAPLWTRVPLILPLPVKIFSLFLTGFGRLFCVTCVLQLK